MPTLLGKKQKPHDFLYWEIHSPFHQAVRMGTWKGIRFGTDEPLELYDLSRDPGEKNNIASNPLCWVFGQRRGFPWVFFKNNLL